MTTETTQLPMQDDTSVEHEEQVLAQATDTDSAEPVEYPETEQTVLADLSTSMTWLLELRDTVQKHGVSRGDMTALSEICQSLEAHGVDFPPTASFEHYPIAAYTSDRTGLNQTVALEGIGATIVQTIKTWIRKLIEFVSKLAKWMKELERNERIQQRRLDSLLDAIHKVRVAGAELEKKYYTPNSELIKLLEDYQQELLKDPSLEPTELQLAGLGEPDLVVELNLLTQRAEKAAMLIAMETRELAETLEIGDVESTLEQLAQMRIRSEMLTSATPDFNTRVLELRERVFGPSYTRKGQTVVAFNYLFSMHAKLEANLKKIRAIDGDDIDTDALYRLVNQLTTASDTVAKLAQLFYQYNQRRLVGLNLVYKYENQKFSQMFRAALADPKNERAQNQLERIRTALVAGISSLLRGF